MQSTHVRSMCCCLTIENEARRSDTPSGGVGTALLRIMGLRTLRPNSAFQALTRRDLESWTLVKTAEFCCCDLPKTCVAAHCSSISRTFLELFVCPMQGVGTTVAQRSSTCTFSGKYGEMLDISGHIWTYLDMIEYWTILNMPDFKTLALWYLARNVQTAKSVICEVYRDLERRCHEVCLVLWQSLVNISCRVLLPRCWQERRQYEESGRAPIDLNLNFRKLSQRQMRQCVRHTAIATKTQLLVHVHK